MSSGAGGRARGRARGRAKVGGDAPGESGPRPGPVRQPGQPPVAVPPPSAPQPITQATAQAVQAAAVVSAPASGRASHRGGAKGEPKPGVAAVTDRMAAMGLGDRSRRRQDPGLSEPTTRPDSFADNKRGTQGEQIILKTNHFELQMAPDYMLYQYSVDFAPEIVNKRFRMALMRDHKELLGDCRAFDGMIMFLPKKLPNKVTEVYSTRQSDGERIRITFTLRAEIAPNSMSALQMYNVIFKRILGMIDCKQIQRHYYAPSLAVSIPKHKFEVWPGYITSILQYETKVMLQADISHKILRSDTVFDSMCDIYNRNPNRYRDELVRQLVGSIVLTRYNNKTYRIDDIDFNQNPKSKFKTSSRKFRGDGDAGQEVEISYCDYYQKQHDLRITDLEQPLLVSRPKKSDIRRGQEGNFYLVPELCTLTGLSDEVFSNYQIMKDIAVHTRVGPDGRMQTLDRFIQRINSQDNVRAELSGWGLKFADSLYTLQGRILPAETIFQGRGAKFSYDPSKADWDRESRGKALIHCVELRNWLFINTRRDGETAQNLLTTLMRVAPPMGFNIGRPTQIQLNDNNTRSYLGAIRENLDQSTQMVMCLLPTNKKDLYDGIKKLCCIDAPVPSQCVISKTVMRRERVMSVATKIAIQMNVKLGGQAWSTDIPMNNVMICGVDTYHDSQVKGRSVAALVCSLNKAATRYYSKTCFQHNHQELCQGLNVCLTAALKKYHEVNGTLPDRIIIYRDGVGDGQLESVFQTEVPQLKSCFNALGADYKPRVAVVVVKKRINTRLFASIRNNISNPPPGTIVDSEVTRPIWADFFLISQSVRQGSVTPSHYNIICDSTGLKPDHFQRLTYKLCHLYFNWPGTIRVPAPCQYAHKLAYFVGQSVHADVSPALSDKLFFL